MGLFSRREEGGLWGRPGRRGRQSGTQLWPPSTEGSFACRHPPPSGAQPPAFSNGSAPSTVSSGWVCHCQVLSVSLCNYVSPVLFGLAAAGKIPASQKLFHSLPHPGIGCGEQRVPVVRGPWARLPCAIPESPLPQKVGRGVPGGFTPRLVFALRSSLAAQNPTLPSPIGLGGGFKVLELGFAEETVSWDPIQKAPPQRTYWLPPLPVLQPSIWFLSTVRLVWSGDSQPSPLTQGVRPLTIRLSLLHTKVHYAACHKHSTGARPGLLLSLAVLLPARRICRSRPRDEQPRLLCLTRSLLAGAVGGGGTAAAVFAVFKSLVLRSLRA